jgi:hypothetical protein
VRDVTVIEITEGHRRRIICHARDFAFAISSQQRPLVDHALVSAVVTGCRGRSGDSSGFGGGRIGRRQCVPDELVEPGGVAGGPEEQRLQHAAVNAEQRVQRQQQVGTAQLLGGMRSLDEVLQLLTGVVVHLVGEVTAFQRSGTCEDNKIKQRAF